MDIRSALKEAMAQLRVARVPSHTLAAELLLMHASGRDRVWLYAHAEEPLDATTCEQYFAMVARRLAGTPTQYLTGKQEFWGLEFAVEPGVLIPRPETEHVIEVALERVGRRNLKRIADVGTGTGCLAVALAREFPDAEVCATDVSATALAVARRNAERHGVAGRIRFVEGSFLEPFLPASSHARAIPFELIVSNPPYVGRRDEDVLPREVREHEPPEALFAGEEGGELYPALIEQAHVLVVPGGLLVLELGYNSLPHVYPLLAESDAGLAAASAGMPSTVRQTRDEQMPGVPAQTAGSPSLQPGAVSEGGNIIPPLQPWRDVRITHDLAGIPRVISAERT